MKVIDTKAPTELEKFYFTLGEMRVEAAIKSQSEEIIIEVEASLAEALNAPDAAEAGRAAFQRGVNQRLDQAIAADAWAIQNKCTRISWVKAALAAHIEAVPAGKVTVRPEKRTLKRKVVEEFDSEGRIKSMLEEEIQV